MTRPALPIPLSPMGGIIRSASCSQTIFPRLVPLVYSSRHTHRWPTLCVYTTLTIWVMRGTTPATARRSCGKGSAADLTHMLRSFPSL